MRKEERSHRFLSIGLGRVVRRNGGVLWYLISGRQGVRDGMKGLVLKGRLAT